MDRYVLKINDSTYVKKLDWLAMQIPIIDTDFFDNAEIYTEDYFNELVIKDGHTRRDILLRYFPQIEIKKVKFVEVDN